jgi:hypothetical protein
MANSPAGEVLMHRQAIGAPSGENRAVFHAAGGTTAHEKRVIY